MMLKVSDLHAARRSLPERFELDVGSRSVTVLEVLRWLPGKRLTARVAEGGVLKLFLGDRASAYQAREARGLDAFATAALPTPALLASGDGWMLFEALTPVRHAGVADVEQIAAALAQLHAAGFQHNDLHLGNFLRSGDVVYLIDGDSVAARRMDTDAAIGELAVLLAQFAVEHDDLTSVAWAAYNRVRPLGGDAAALAAVLRRARARRLAHYLAKSRRPCTEFDVQRVAAGRLAYRRVHEAAARALAEDPQAFFGEGADLLKAGGSATVVRAELAGERWIIKRYNLKNPWHRLRRAFKRRARHAWEAALALEFLGIPTASAAVLLESGPSWLPGPAYLVTRDVGDDHLAALTQGDAVSHTLLDAIVMLLKRLKRARISHGDLKSTNLILCGQELALIDVDGLQFEQGTLAPDVRRLLANWPDGSPVRAAVDAAIRQSAELREDLP